MMKTRLLLFLFSLSVATAQAQLLRSDSDEDAELRYYSVEVIIFTYEEDMYSGTEMFLPDEPPADEALLYDQDGNPLPDDGEIPVFSDKDPAPNSGDADSDEPAPYWIVVPAQSSSEFASRPMPDDANPYRLALLGQDESLLANALRKFELLDAYETLLHVGWTQPAYEQEQTPPIELSLFGALPDGLDGSFTLYLSRYLHLVVDVTLDAPQSARFADTEPRFSFGDSFRRAEPAPQPVRWRISEDRIFKNGDMRYFDHPKFGILAKVVRVEKPDDGEDGSAGRFAD